MSHQSMIDKTARIVFVSNIPTEIPEDKLRELFGKIGPVVSYRIIYDKETGKSRGCAVCEYKDQENALSAVKTLNNVELGGRNLKVDHALNEKSRLEMISVMQGSIPQNSEPNNSSEKTPETISKAVASLPPEQMFELLKQMKQCVQNNAAEAKNMLLQNPQLAYALLQALVVMRIVDPQIAFTALSNSGTTSSTSISYSATSISESSIAASNMINRISTPLIHTSIADSKSIVKNPVTQPALSVPVAAPRPFTNSQPIPPPAPTIPFPIVPPPAPSVSVNIDTDMRSKNVQSMNRTDTDRVKPLESFKRDPRLQQQDTKQPSVNRIPPPSSGPSIPATSVPSAPRLTSTIPPTNPAGSKPTSSTPDNEKAALIMQVLRLTDAQIAMLPPEQRQSIMLLKEQIAKSTKR